MSGYSNDGPGGYPPPPPPPQGYYGQPPMPAGGDYPIQVTFQRPERSSRILAGLSIPFFLARYIMLIPAVIVLYFVGIAAFVVVWIGFWAVLFTGHYPQGMYNFVSGYVRWNTRVSAYLFGLTDRYPPFRLAY